MLPNCESMSDNNPKKWLLCFTALLIFLWSEGFQLRTLQFSEKYWVLRIVCVFLIVLWAAIRMLFADIKPLFRNCYFMGMKSGNPISVRDILEQFNGVIW